MVQVATCFDLFFASVQTDELILRNLYLDALRSGPNLAVILHIVDVEVKLTGVVKVRLCHRNVTAVAAEHRSHGRDLVGVVLVRQHLHCVLLGVSDGHLATRYAQELDIVFRLARDSYSVWGAEERERSADALIIDPDVFIDTESRSEQNGRLYCAALKLTLVRDSREASS